MEQRPSLRLPPTRRPLARYGRLPDYSLLAPASPPTSPTTAPCYFTLLSFYSLLLNLFVVAALVTANGFFVAAEFALVKVRQGELKALAKTGHRKARRALSIQQNLDTYLSACQWGITLACLGLGWVGEPMVATALAPILAALNIPAEWNHYIAFPVAFTVITFLHITLGEQVPKIYAIAKSHRVTLLIAHPLHWFAVCFKPFIWALNAQSNSMLRIIGFDTSEPHGSALTATELRLLLRESQDGGHVSVKEHKMIVNVLDLEDKFARRYAVPRHAVVTLDINKSLEENLQLAARSQHTRLTPLRWQSGKMPRGHSCQRPLPKPRRAPRRDRPQVPRPPPQHPARNHQTGVPARPLPKEERTPRPARQRVRQPLRHDHDGKRARRGGRHHRG
ncbi:MAG: HlyC/CorC family transporter [Candidatus Synoicihabitans palmerolidicus]|nr:HlyC/CorC family transporter [Candidatus Synoicihabitans palmerolidicus]